jgi:hypothetical protein
MEITTKKLYSTSPSGQFHKKKLSASIGYISVSFDSVYDDRGISYDKKVL